MMRIIVIGGKGLAEQVADALHRAGDEVTVIETEPGREPALAKAGLRAMHGDALVPTTLEAAGALRADQSWGIDALVSPATSLVSMIRHES
jgi:Trk K+ transport system NAD-binding subunit